MKNNLLEILQLLLQENPCSQCDVQISIFTNRNDCRVVENAVNQLISRFNNLHIILEVFGCGGNDIHHRILMTNNLRINCDAGFDLFRRSQSGYTITTITTKEAEITISFPYFTPQDSQNLKAYKDDITNARRILRITGQTSVNRLLTD